MDSWDIALRLVVATLVGAAIGLDRDLQGKPTGMRTLAVVSLGSALVVLVGSNIDAAEPDWDAVSRIIQGILTGIGFLGAGVRRSRGALEDGIVRHAAHATVFDVSASHWRTSCAARSGFC